MFDINFIAQSCGDNNGDNGDEDVVVDDVVLDDVDVTIPSCICLSGFDTTPFIRSLISVNDEESLSNRLHALVVVVQ